MSTSVIQVTASSHFTIKLTHNNFPVWRKHIRSTLIGLGLEKFITGPIEVPSEFLDKESTKPNPEYAQWMRQDQMILSAILGSCSDPIQPILSSAETSREAWEILVTSYANSSRSRIISLKSRLAKNPKGTRSVAEFLHDMKSIADELALAQSPVKDEDLQIHILGQLGDEYRNFVAALKARDTALSFSELFQKLVDFERSLKEDVVSSPSITTVNYTNKLPRHNQRVSLDPRSGRYQSNNYNPRASRNHWSNSPTFNNGNRPNRNSITCQFCNIPGHEAKDCRKLARFLRDNHVTIATQNNATPTANVAISRPNSVPPTWMWDTGASDHATSDRTPLHTLSEYGGPDEIVLGDGSSHGGAPNAGGELS
ncbi:putative RNA-directed DNA polymerase [Helianthus debilis subsp. tardiflorus]